MLFVTSTKNYKKENDVLGTVSQTKQKFGMMAIVKSFLVIQPVLLLQHKYRAQKIPKVAEPRLSVYSGNSTISFSSEHRNRFACFTLKFFCNLLTEV